MSVGMTGSEGSILLPTRQVSFAHKYVVNMQKCQWVCYTCRHWWRYMSPHPSVPLYSPSLYLQFCTQQWQKYFLPCQKNPTLILTFHFTRENKLIRLDCSYLHVLQPTQYLLTYFTPEFYFFASEFQTHHSQRPFTDTVLHHYFQFLKALPKPPLGLHPGLH